MFLLMSTLFPHRKFLSFLRHSEGSLSCAAPLCCMVANATLALSSDATHVDGTDTWELGRHFFPFLLH